MLLNRMRAAARVAVLLLAFGASAAAQNYASGSIYGNAGASTAPPREITPTSWLDRWCGSTNEMFLRRSGGTWGCTTLASGVATWLVTPSSANLRSALTDETGTGAAYFQGGDIGTPSAGVLTNATGLPISTGVSGLASGVATFLATPSSANLRAALTDESGTGVAYFQGGALGTPSSGTLTNATGLPISTGVSGLGTGVATALGTNVGSSGAFVTNGGALGTPSSGTLTSATGLPISTGVSGLGTGVATALGTNVGSAGAFVTNGGALGTPSSGTLTNATGLPISTGVSGLASGVATFLATPSSANLAAALTDEVGSGSALFGSRSGNTSTFGTTSGTLTSGNCAKFDASGNIVDHGSACGGGGGGTGVSANLLINPRGYIDQRNVGAATVVADNAYGPDRWRALGEASLTITARDTTISAASGIKIRFTGTTDKGGIFQVVEGKNCKHLRSTAAVFSAVVAVSNARLGNIKMGILEFTGTEDSVSGDPVSSWGADGTTPTLAANWAFINTPSNLSVTTSAATYSVTASFGASMTNCAVMIWNDDKSYTANDELYVTDMQLNRGSSAQTFEPRPISVEFDMARRYYEKKGGNANNEAFPYSAIIVSSNGAYYVMEFYPKRVAPTLTFASASAYQIVSAAALGGTALNSITSSNEGLTTAFLTLQCAGTPWTAGQSGLLRDAGSSTGVIQISAEL